MQPAAAKRKGGVIVDINSTDIDESESIANVSAYSPPIKAVQFKAPVPMGERERLIQERGKGSGPVRQPPALLVIPAHGDNAQMDEHDDDGTDAQGGGYSERGRERGGRGVVGGVGGVHGGHHNVSMSPIDNVNRRMMGKAAGPPPEQRGPPTNNAGPNGGGQGGGGGYSQQYKGGAGGVDDHRRILNAAVNIKPSNHGGLGAPPPLQSNVRGRERERENRPQPVAQPVPLVERERERPTPSHGQAVPTPQGGKVSKVRAAVANAVGGGVGGVETRRSEEMERILLQEIAALDEKHKELLRDTAVDSDEEREKALEREIGAIGREKGGGKGGVGGGKRGGGPSMLDRERERDRGRVA